jgi:hypothetical protein
MCRFLRCELTHFVASESFLTILQVGAGLEHAHGLCLWSPMGRTRGHRFTAQVPTMLWLFLFYALNSIFVADRQRLLPLHLGPHLLPALLSPATSFPIDLSLHLPASRVQPPPRFRTNATPLLLPSMNSAVHPFSVTFIRTSRPVPLHLLQPQLVPADASPVHLDRFPKLQQHCLPCRTFLPPLWKLR